MSPKLVSCHLMLRSPAGLVERILEELLICLRAGGEMGVGVVSPAADFGDKKRFTYWNGPQKRGLPQNLTQLVCRNVVHFCSSHTTFK